VSMNQRLASHLGRLGLRATVVQHRGTESTREAAHAACVPEDRVAKVVVMRDVRGANLMIVLPADAALDACVARDVTGHTGLCLEEERVLLRLFDDCEIGAMPPFGSLYGLPTFVDPCLLDGRDIWFRAGNRHELARLSVADFARAAGQFSSAACLHGRAPTTSAA
jgi:Ala-tRNA(Pro) deacylase